MNTINLDPALDPTEAFTVNANKDGKISAGDLEKVIQAMRGRMERTSLTPEQRAEAEAKVGDLIEKLSAGGDAVWRASAEGIRVVLKRMAEKLDEIRPGLMGIAQAQHTGKDAFQAGQAYSEVSLASGILQIAVQSLDHILGDCGCQDGEHGDDAERPTEPPPAPEATPEAVP